MSIELMNCTEGTKVELTTGDVFEFVRLKRTKFIGKRDGQNYDIPVQMFKKVIGTAPKKELNKSYESLTKNELFYIKDNKGNALIFKFDEIKNNKIIGVNPVSGTKTRIDVALYVGKVSEI
ncbi:hypothetical protein [Priestia megaterium]|uniref:hypothetical protein n=1 Tax=Priestia megaterium TaxID=1404 RepID=UPI003CC61FF7